MINVEDSISWTELEERVRSVPLLEPRDGKPVYPYLHADIQLREVSFKDVRPTTLYVVKGLLAKQRELAGELARLGIDPLDLDEAVVLRDPEATDSVGLIPPIVEETIEHGPYILDGAHRTYNGKELGRMTFKALYISGFRDDCPAYALPNEWDEIIEYDEVPSDSSLKKRYRENYRGLYRNFGPINGTKLREQPSK